MVLACHVPHGRPSGKLQEVQVGLESLVVHCPSESIQFFFSAFQNLHVQHSSEACG